MGSLKSNLQMIIHNMDLLHIFETQSTKPCLIILSIILICIATLVAYRMYHYNKTKSKKDEIIDQLTKLIDSRESLLTSSRKSSMNSAISVATNRSRVRKLDIEL